MLEAYAGEIASTASALIWALSLTLFARAGRTVRPRALNIFKNVVAAPLFLATMIVAGTDLFPTLDAWTWGLLAVSAILGITISDPLIFASLNRVGAGWTAVVTCTYSPLVIAVTAIGFGVPLTWAVTLGSIIVGVAVVLAAGRVRFRALEGRTLAIGLGFGVLGQLVMAIGVALLKYPVWGHPALMDVLDIMTLTFWRMVVGTLALVLWMRLRRDRVLSRALFRPSEAWRSMIPGSILGSYVAMILWMYGMQEITGSLTRAAILNQLTAILLPLFGFLMLGEPISRRKTAAVGLAVVGASIVVAGR